MAARILLVEDNAALRDMLAAHLAERGMRVDAVSDGAAALSAAAGAAHDAVILDLGLPDMDGLEVLRALHGLPTLILTARDGVADRVRGLDAGADDYLVKPFDPAELEARLRALLRRPGLRAEREYAWRGLRFVPALRVLEHEGENVELTPRETAVMEVLIRAGERVVVRDALAERLEDDLSPNALEAVMSRLRRKLASFGAVWRIETVRGIGYRLSGEG